MERALVVVALWVSNAMLPCCHVRCWAVLAVASLHYASRNVCGSGGCNG